MGRKSTGSEPRIARSARTAKPPPRARLRLGLRPILPQPRSIPTKPAKRPANNPYEIDLDRNPANFQPLTPVSFLQRTAQAHPDITAIIHGARRYTYAEFYARSRQLASALAREGIGLITTT